MTRGERGRSPAFLFLAVFLVPELLTPVVLSPGAGSSPFDQGSLLVQSTLQPKRAEEECQVSPEFGCLDPGTVRNLTGKCPSLKPKVWKGYYPRGQKAAGNYTELANVSSQDECVKQCCFDPNCHYSFMVNVTCYLLNCRNGAYLCEPILTTEMKEAANLSLVLVRTPKVTHLTGVTCEVGEDSACKTHQKCIPTNHRSRNGVCVCDNGFDYDAEHNACVEEKSKSSSSTSPIQETSRPTSTTAPPSPVLTVSVTSKNVTLPENEVSLAAYVVPQPSAGHPYSYKWDLISNPADDTATVEGHTTDTLRLTGLKEGRYVFRVTAFNTQSNGSANASISVFAEKKPNQAPVAVISPQEQSIQLPTSSAVLDASLSTDDDKIISYKWELQKGPILYALNPAKSLNSSTLQVENLIPGNYTFKLIVEDSEHVTNSTTANITVIKEPDYPPTANPGKDIVVYLPQTEVVLNGNASTDDKKIVDWEWKSTGEQSKAIDMQDTHTPYLKLSHLQVGLYQFELKVTDEGGQFSSATVHVIVKEATGTPPKADAGSDQTIVLNKQNWAILDASKSRSESNKLTQYKWQQISGPNNATVILLENGIRANATGLTKGEYEFFLLVEDESKLTGNATVKINVIQRVNEPPHANAGGRIQVKAPVSRVLINGNASTDDVKIVSWSWERMPDSLAAGTILENSNSTPILQLADLVPGRYSFKLTVKDEQGAASEDIAAVIVSSESKESDLIEVLLEVPITQLTEADRLQVLQQLSLLLHDIHLVLDKIEHQLHSDNVIFQLHGESKNGQVVNGSLLAKQLRQRLYQDANILQFPVYSIDTVLCLDECSNHGTCQDTPSGRECICNAFWMENFLKKRFGTRERNCEWSKIYVGVVVFLLLSMMFALIWSISFIFRRNFGTIKENINGGPSSSPSRGNSKRTSSKKQYTLLDDDELELNTPDDEGESDDSDSDVLFEDSKRSKSKNGGLLMMPLTSTKPRNGILKNTRRIKT